MTNTMRLRTPRCPVCGKSEVIEVRTDSFAAWQNGALIQDAFPDLSPATREQIKTGYHEDCWAQVFPDEETGQAKPKPRAKKPKPAPDGTVVVPAELAGVFPAPSEPTA